MTKIIAATGCPTGIAHTFMAKKALEDAAKAKGIEIKVETHGQAGIENALTPQEIAEADGVIIAADKDVDEDRFAGKRVLKVSVTKGIKEPDKLIEEIVSGSVPLFKSGKTPVSANTSGSVEKESFAHKLYVYLMNGVSHMLPVVVAGGVLLAISFMFGINSADPKSHEYNVFAANLNAIGKVGLGLMVPILSAYIAQAIGKRPGLIIGFITGMIAYTNGTGFLGGIVSGFMSGYLILLIEQVLKGLPRQFDGLKSIFLLPVLGGFIGGYLMVLLSSPMTAINEGMMHFLSNMQNQSPLVLGLIVGMMCAFDMGGPVNKAAYVTGVALLGQGNFYFMAGVSAACIAPPIATGFAVLFAGKYFEKEERNAGYVNFLLGSTHITEGAIPFAAKNPLVVIPSLMVGSSIAAILTYYLKVQVPAPHGGFIVLPIVTHPLLWVLAILAGALVSGYLIAADQKHRYKKNMNLQAESAAQSPASTHEKDAPASETSGLLKKENIYFEKGIRTKDELFRFIAEKMQEKGVIQDQQQLIRAFQKRENQSSTGMEGGFAIPHAQSETINQASMLVIKLADPITDWPTLDNNPVTFIIAFMIPPKGSEAHLHYLSDTAQKLVDQNTVHQLKNAEHADQIFALLR
ncbi:fructose-specific PTS transporter subunit EIIC [Sporolactobacillus sp. CPB3-1]|uniref:Fructose-specific PTS transporter subunit EIIC n=1 Tax=Sporolactobacillus mangiferae TaxID=2940498 RepID=A0ABT0M9B4_9BACL|nr:fructose-specific PTS transporter subunit EIIC [Sporolactobacillus mangiferae]MCL1631470.1 fructose-specific PTS transporter subunit EIIC [Sporolactobacillus mangiferae]